MILLILLRCSQTRTTQSPTGHSYKVAKATNGSRIPKPPRALFTLLEGRALLEIALLPALYPLLHGTPHGDGHPVLLVPGFTASDATLVGLSAFLRSRGYHVETWGLGQNTGFKLKFSHALEQKLRFMHHRHRRKGSLVGWSLGGVYAFYAAHSAPECVRSVVSLGSPTKSKKGKKKKVVVRKAAAKRKTVAKARAVAKRKVA